MKNKDSRRTKDFRCFDDHYEAIETLILQELGFNSFMDEQEFIDKYGREAEVRMRELLMCLLMNSMQATVEEHADFVYGILEREQYLEEQEKFVD